MNTFFKNIEVVNFFEEWEDNARKIGEYKYVYSLELYFLILLLMHIFLYFYCKWKIQY